MSNNKLTYLELENKIQDLETQIIHYKNLLASSETHEDNSIKKIMDSIPGFAFLKDSNLNYVQANRTFCDLLHIPYEQIRGKTDYDIFPKDLADKYTNDDKKVIQTGKPIFVEEVTVDQTNKGKRFVVATRKLPWKDDEGNIIGIYGLGFDITELKEIEDELKIAKKKAEKADEHKTIFLSTMSHEIRTPINSILGITDLIIQEENKLSDEHKNYIHIIKKSGSLLLNIINDILDISKINAGHITINHASFSLKDLINKIFHSIKVLLEQKNNDITLIESLDSNIPDYVVGDEFRLQQILINLLSNSCKFTEEGYIKFGGYLKNNNDIEFFVEDTGKGIKEEHLKLIYHPFTQAEQGDNREYGGSGLGLTIAKNLVELQGGTISIESRTDENHGTKVLFTIPFVEGKKTIQEEKEIDLSLKLSNKKVLLAEDDEINRFLVKTILENIGINVLIARDGIEAVEIFKREPHIDLIITDSQMPKKTGLEATKEIREIEKAANTNKHVPIIMLSASALSKDIESSYSFGVDVYHTKPIKNQELLKTVIRLLKL
ncbi:MAG: PAS domain-containing protein [Leptospiraceae bacterium]|nr:PAS domain-containing protein [Leptospiraceae bacterium]